jgi:hypothetical protein
MEQLASIQTAREFHANQIRTRAGARPDGDTSLSSAGHFPILV